MRRTVKVNNEVLKRMRMIYYPKGYEYIDWMGFWITEENKPSYHHIEKAEDFYKLILYTISLLNLFISFHGF